MSNILQHTLFYRQRDVFNRVRDLSREFAGVYCGSTIVKDSIFSIIENYARKKELSLELMRYPFNDDELWAFTFVKKGSIFLCVNAQLPMCKQIFAAAHELYHIHCYALDIERNTITAGSLLDSHTADIEAITQEDLEANAFAGLLLMPDSRLFEQLSLFDMEAETLDTDNILTLMELSALPYTAVVLRLFELGVITEKKAAYLLECDYAYICDRIDLTGKAGHWQMNSREQIYLGSLMDNLSFNSEHELLTQTREADDHSYLNDLMSYFKGV